MKKKQPTNATPLAPKVLKVTLSKTADGEHDYLQILSADLFSTNIVLVADGIEVNDTRPKK